jgi:hypothetical protein
MTTTIQQKLVDGLLAQGWVEGRQTAHYRTFTHPTQPGKFFAGKAGALRFAKDGLVGHCVLVSSRIRDRILSAPLAALGL